jgi:hypothetical protein
MRDWFASLSWPGVFVYFAAAFGLIFWITGIGSGQPASAAGLMPSLLAGVVFSALMTPFTMLRRRRANPTRRAAVPLGAALREGKLPGLINPEPWLTALKARAASNQSLRRICIVMLVLAAIIPLFSIGNRSWIGPVILAALLIAVSVWRIVTAQIELPRIAKLEADIRTTYGIAPDPEPERLTS